MHDSVRVWGSGICLALGRVLPAAQACTPKGRVCEKCLQDTWGFACLWPSAQCVCCWWSPRCWKGCCPSCRALAPWAPGRGNRAPTGRQDSEWTQSGSRSEWCHSEVSRHHDLGHWSGLKLLFWTIILIARLMMSGDSDPAFHPPAGGSRRSGHEHPHSRLHHSRFHCSLESLLQLRVDLPQVRRLRRAADPASPLSNSWARAGRGRDGPSETHCPQCDTATGGARPVLGWDPRVQFLASDRAGDTFIEERPRCTNRRI